MINCNLELSLSQAALLKNILLEYLTEDLLKVPFDPMAQNVPALKDLYCVFRSLLPMMQQVEKALSDSRSFTSPYDCYDSEFTIYQTFKPFIDWMPSEDAVKRS